MYKISNTAAHLVYGCRVSINKKMNTSKAFLLYVARFCKTFCECSPVDYSLDTISLSKFSLLYAKHMEI